MGNHEFQIHPKESHFCVVSSEGELTFFPPEDVLSGFTETLFSLLDDLERLVFSFSAEVGGSEDGLVLLLFLQESGERGGGKREGNVWITQNECVV